MFLLPDADRGIVAFAVLVPSTICAVVAIVSLEPVARWFRLRTGPLVLWAVGLPMILVLERTSRFRGDLTKDVSLQTQTFFAILVGLTCALGLRCGGVQHDGTRRRRPVGSRARCPRRAGSWRLAGKRRRQRVAARR